MTNNKKTTTHALPIAPAPPSLALRPQLPTPESSSSREISLEELIELQQHTAAQKQADVREILSRGTHSRSDLQSACYRVGRDDAPDLIRKLWQDEAWRPAVAGVVGSVWSMAEHPERLMPRSEWIEMFRAAGFRVDDEIAEGPSDVITVYRGASPEGRLGMSWTTDLTTARTFARGGLRGRCAGSVWTARLSPEFALAQIGGAGTRGEDEVVVDPAGLDKVAELEPYAPQEAESNGASERLRPDAIDTKRDSSRRDLPPSFEEAAA